MCWSDVCIKYFTCGATTGELNLQGLGPMGMAATSTQSPRTCPAYRQAETEYAAYSRRCLQRQAAHMQQATRWSQGTGLPVNLYPQGAPPPNPDRFDIWLVTHPACPPQRKIYYGTWKYARHCLLDPTGHHNACTQVPQTLIIQLRKS
ncbi:hypothetical protein B0H10DRAFT_2246160 [Mycena sp. CBHHK59/15]|nr:hypothetical protein B0H10DRAFT_2246160 [Mycena sp. CBHHK59/15]